MAISVPWSDTDNDYKTVTTLWFYNAIKNTEIDEDDWLIICLVADSDVSISTVKLVGENEVDLGAPTVAVTATNTGNTIASIQYIKVTSLPYSSPFNVKLEGLSSSEAKAATIYSVRGLDNSPYDKSSSATGTGDSPSAGPTATLSQANEIGIGCIGTEGPSDDQQGTWTFGTGYVFGNALYDGTNANGATANQCVHSVAEILSETNGQSVMKTGITNRDWAACVATFKGAAGGINVTPAAAITEAGLVAPSVVLGSASASPAMANSEASGENPLVVHGSINITPGYAEAESSGEDPTIIHGPINIVPALAESETASQGPSVIQGSVSATPGLLGAEAGAEDPSVLAGGGVEVTPGVAEALASTLDPTTVLGSLNVTPAIAEVLAEVLDPSVIKGSIAITPALAETGASGEDPDIILGSIALTPAIAQALASCSDPVVLTGGLIVTPAIAGALVEALDPSAILGSVSIVPGLLEALTEALDPNVLETGPQPPRMRTVNLFWTFGVGLKR